MDPGSSVARVAEAAAAAVAAAAAAEAASARRSDDEGAGEVPLLLLPLLLFPPPPRCCCCCFPAAAVGKRDLLPPPLLLLLLLTLLSPLVLLFLLPLPLLLSAPSVFLRRAEAASLSPTVPPAPPPPAPLPRTAPLLSAAWKEERRTLSPSGGPASTHDDGEEDGEGADEGGGEEVDADDASFSLEWSPLSAAEEAEGAFSLPPALLLPSCFAWHAVPDLSRYVDASPVGRRATASERAASRRGAVGIGEHLAAAAVVGAALREFFLKEF